MPRLRLQVSTIFLGLGLIGPSVVIGGVAIAVVFFRTLHRQDVLHQRDVLEGIVGLAILFRWVLVPVGFVTTVLAGTVQLFVRPSTRKQSVWEMVLALVVVILWLNWKTIL